MPGRARQISAAADSIVLNTAEGTWYGTPGMKCRHFGIARASAGEVIAGLYLLARNNGHLAFGPLLSDARMIIKMLSGLIDTFEQQRADEGAQKKRPRDRTGPSTAPP